MTNWTSLKLKMFDIQNKKIKRQAIDWDKILQNMSDKRILSKIHREFYNSPR